MKKILALVLIFVCVPKAMAQFSFSTDFDGRGTGGSISFNRPTFGGSGPSYNSPQREPRNGGGGGGSSYEDQRHLRKVYEQQVREAKRRAEEERIRQELERQRRAN